MAAYKQREWVKWKWGPNWAQGQVTKTFREKVTRKLQGSEVTRKGSDETPAYLIKQEDGTRVLKLHSELEKA
ncbi:DUF2945 domain-containing protein [Salinicola rhizosphaerae]|uniref:Hypervirulence associated protein TUDOR domain-containing protein n=1 Tax=Salinicola rhizosphaerae TaxID=1443141 RepID=A0ABQ3DTM3_9GAMM|nr:DUF2945 domain-containing protein [Salinicola rhizosphaerae]GHB14775.1 hypothetical protein GCM10009038_11540 [Salinicola rhizosphaerae]